MASLFKRRITTYQLPDGRQRTPDGRRVTKATPGAVKVDKGLSAIWYGRYKAADGTFQNVPLCGDKTASKQMLGKLIADAKLAEHGLGDRFAEHRKRPLAEHLADWGDPSKRTAPGTGTSSRRSLVSAACWTAAGLSSPRTWTPPACNATWPACANAAAPYRPWTRQRPISRNGSSPGYWEFLPLASLRW